ncbi:sulfotransferase family 2 domain-containing protein [Paracoccus tegillarcae]|uniref:Sulfotransferase family protein n=1 Tax=Paracoccus tegillarcae TaxID=1529068 RepID=A0A2K9EKM8_9RHOB|nr:sulfotransferase family 2 domain-containing protein [Paracoccus tegillarcae]AUH32135.1 hypothetical protein CUV01_00820 [Paracoccus tegillarcae]
MLIFWEPRLVFLATPKAGSTAIEAALEPLAAVAMQRPAALKHVDKATLDAHVLPWLESAAGSTFTTVALMREPVEWLRSWYRFKLRDDHEDPEHRMEGVSFAQFAHDYASPDGPQHLNLVPQHRFLSSQGRTVDRIFRYEEMQNFVDFLEDQLDCAISLPRLNVPPTVDVDLAGPDEQALRQAMAADIALYETI